MGVHLGTLSATGMGLDTDDALMSEQSQIMVLCLAVPYLLRSDSGGASQSFTANTGGSKMSLYLTMSFSPQAILQSSL